MGIGTIRSCPFAADGTAFDIDAVRRFDAQGAATTGRDQRSVLPIQLAASGNAGLIGGHEIKGTASHVDIAVRLDLPGRDLGSGFQILGSFQRLEHFLLGGDGRGIIGRGKLGFLAVLVGLLHRLLRVEGIKARHRIFGIRIVKADIVVTYRRHAIGIDLGRGRAEATARDVQIAPGFARDGEFLPVETVRLPDIRAAADIAGNALVSQSLTVHHVECDAENQQQLDIFFHANLLKDDE